MIGSYSDANRELDHLLEFFFVICAMEILAGADQRRWWFTVVWLGAGIFNGAIRASGSLPCIAINLGKIDELAGGLADRSDELAYQRSFGGKLLKFTSLLAAAVMTAELTLGCPWWAALLIGMTTWFVSLLSIPLLSAPRTMEDENEIVP